MDRSELVKSIQQFLANNPELTRSIERVTDILPLAESQKKAIPYITAHLEEAEDFWNMISPYWQPYMRVLEVGGGTGAFHILAATRGMNICSIEPSSPEWSFAGDCAKQLIQHVCGKSKVRDFMNMTAEHLLFFDNTFNLVISNNTLEHLDDPRTAIKEMLRVTKVGGIHVHNAPNYDIPYEPHYRVFTPFGLRFCGNWLYPLAGEEYFWQHIKEVNPGLIREAYADAGSVEFLDAIGLVLKKGDAFRTRHPVLSRLVDNPMAKYVRGLLPNDWQTPMTFVARKEQWAEN